MKCSGSFSILIASLIAATCVAEPAKNIPTADGKEDLRFDFLEPGFAVRELPLRLPNLNNIEYTPDGRVFAAGYDGRVHLIRDTNGDGLEDAATVFWEGKGDYEMPLGLVVRGDSVFVTLRRRIERLRDTDADGVADKMEVAATGWHQEITQEDKTFLHRRVDDAIGLAMDEPGNFYTSLGTPNFRNLYQLDENGKSHYRRDRFRGSVVRIAPGGRPEILATGVRFLVSMQFNKHGDLFATDQEGATWGPGNPFDELLHIQRGRHYGFPPRDSKLLSDVVDEPSVVDFGPQHQSTCGFRFDEARPKFLRFGPDDWEGSALVTGESRGKLWRVLLVKTRAGYVGKPVLIGALNLMPIDVAISPAGDLLVCCHSGKPDWGTGPKGEGRLFKVSHTAPHEPRLAVTWPAGLTEVCAAFTGALPEDAKFEVEILGGRYVRAGDDLETFRPGYEVVKNEQEPAPRHRVKVNAGRLADDRRTVLVSTAPHPWPGNYGLTLRWQSEKTGRNGTVRGDYDFDGVRATWTPSGAARPVWSGWLPHPNLDVARAWTLGSGDHEALFAKLSSPGTLRLTGTLAGCMEPTTLEALASTRGTLQFRDTRISLVADEPSSHPMSESAQPFAATIETGGGHPPSLTFTTRTGPGASERPIFRQALRTPDAPTIAAPGAPPKLTKAPAFVRGDVARGREIFETSCALCHTLRGQGGKVGPDLSNSPERDPTALREDIVNPNAALNPDYIGIELDLNDGETMIGTIASDRPGRFLIQQAGGISIEVRHADIKATRLMEVSLMPTGFDALGEEGLRDLITYLITPVGGK